jgi:hypothetical protein
MSPELFHVFSPLPLPLPPFLPFMQVWKKNKSKAKSFSNINKDVSTIFHAKYDAFSINDKVSIV